MAGYLFVHAELCIFSMHVLEKCTCAYSFLTHHSFSDVANRKRKFYGETKRRRRGTFWHGRKERRRRRKTRRRYGGDVLSLVFFSFRQERRKDPSKEVFGLFSPTKNEICWHLKKVRLSGTSVKNARQHKLFFYFKAICLPKKVVKKRTLHWSIKHLFVLNQEERLFFLLCSALGIIKKEEGKEEAR